MSAPISSDLGLSGKVCLISGANGGIGSACVRLFLTLGARVIATDRQAHFAADDLRYGYGAALDYQCFDLLSESGLSSACAATQAAQPHVLVNNAGLFDMGSVLDADLGQYDRVFGVNVRAFFALMQAAARSMREAGAGAIVNLSSQAGHRGEALVAHYCASKAAVISYTQSAALALASFGVRVNAVSPGVIDTAMWTQVDRLFARFEKKKIGQKREEVAKAVPLGRMGTADDVARVIAFLASDLSAYMTAQTLGVDGGNVLR